MDLADPRSRQYYENRPELKRYIDKLKRDAGQPVVRKPERNELCPCAVSYTHLDFQYNSRLGLDLDRIRKNKLLLIDTCSFVGCFINLKYAETAGLPISEFFIYGDDQEYTARLRKLAPAYLDFDSVIVHKAPSNKGADVVSADETRIERFFYQARNGMYIARKNGKVGRRLRVIGGRIKNILRKAPDHKAKRVWVTCKGTISGLSLIHILVQPSNRPVTRDTFYKSIDEPGFIENIKVGFQPKARLKSVLPNKLIQKIKSL